MHLIRWIGLGLLAFATVVAAQEPSDQFQGQPVYRVGNGITPPKATYRPEPGYSKLARKKLIKGTVLLSVIVAPDGKAHNITVKKGLGYGLEEEAVKAVEQWRFEPALKNGEPVAVQIAILVSFRLY